jgi:hypothetical protein
MVVLIVSKAWHGVYASPLESLQRLFTEAVFEQYRWYLVPKQWNNLNCELSYC